MDTHIDFLQCLETDMAFNILMRLDDPADLVRTSCVSHFWRRFVIANGFSKQLCVKSFPQLSSVEHVTNTNCRSTGVGSCDSIEWKIHEADHIVHASLLQVLNISIRSPIGCIEKAVSASSTDNYPDESIINTLDPRDRYVDEIASYWSSKGQKDPAVPEALIYKLRANLCVITEIKIRPFEAFFQAENPIYSAKFVRFRTGHPKSPSEIGSLINLPLEQPADDKFVWTYTSQEFPMAQENRLQQFKLPEPVLCIGGFLQIELFGRVQKQEMDGLFYICVGYVQVVGRPLFPAFDIEILEPSGKCLLKYDPEALNRTGRSTSHHEGSEDIRVLSPEDVLWGQVGLLEYLMGGNQPGPEHLHWNDDDDDADNDEDDDDDELLNL